MESEGYWVKQSVKIHKVTADDKKAIGLPTMPRPEIDLVALSVKNNELLLVEVKSFLDSQGVYFGHSAIGEFPPDSWSANRYRLFANPTFQEIVTKRIKEQFLEDGLINNTTKIKYALAVGKFYPRTEVNTEALFLRKGWILFTPQKIKDKIRTWAKRGWEDNLATITAKLLVR